LSTGKLNLLASQQFVQIGLIEIATGQLPAIAVLHSLAFTGIALPEISGNCQTLWSKVYFLQLSAISGKAMPVNAIASNCPQLLACPVAISTKPIHTTCWLASKFTLPVGNLHCQHQLIRKIH
jgi:hypothetical protein